jgi:CheY-like chemotaxis protein
VITLDISTHGVDGCNLLSDLKEDPTLKDIPLVVVTMLNESVQGYTLGPAEYLRKPISKEHLLDAISRLLPGQLAEPILIVEDDDATREGLKRILESRGWSVRCASHGQEALDLMSHIPTGLLLLDLMMPKMDGFRLLEAFQSRKEWHQIPVIILTAKQLTEEDLARLQQPQIQKVFHKGHYSKDELVEAVRRYALKAIQNFESGPDKS